MDENVWLRFSSPNRRQERLKLSKRKIAGHRRAHRSAADLARVQVNHRSQILPSIVRPNVRDARRPDPVRGIKREVAIQNVR
jgi:hypothetical protein